MAQSTLKCWSVFGLSLLSAAMLTACGGGGVDNSRLLMPDPMNPTKPSTTSKPDGGISAAAAVCASNNPFKSDSGTHTIGTLKDEKAWIKDYVQRDYLWYQDIPTVDSTAAKYSDENAVYSSLDNYFEALKTPLLTTSGAKKDKFSFTYPTKQWKELFSSGVTFSYGIEWKYSSKTAPWQMQVAYVTPNSPAALAGVQRGDTLKTINGLAADGSVTVGFNNELYPATTTSRAFVFARSGSADLSLNITPANVTSKPVLLNQVVNYGSGGKAGYIVFNDHIATAESQLIAAVNQFKTAQVDTLVLDLRYNGGGYLYIASQLAYMIAGDTATKGKVFEQLQYNDKRTADTANGKTLFESTSCQLDANLQCTSQQPLPTLNLKQIFVIASADTCSASEAIINGLRGIDIDVQIIGNTTCGKPYGFVGKSNCGISYFPMEFQGVNAKGFGDYADGFVPECKANDDLSKSLGDPNEGMLAAALFRKQNPGACKPVATNALTLNNAEQAHLRRPVVLENKFWLAR